MLSSAFCSVLIECEGGFPERFLNLAAKDNIALWDVRRDGASLWCRADAAHYSRLRPIARRAQVRMRVRKKQGALFRVRRLGLRFGTAVGTLLFFVILQLLSARVWVLQVEGNTTVTDAEVLAVLQPLGVYEGADFSKVDVPNLRLTALQQLPDLIWLTVNQNGSMATIKVQERTPTAPVADTAPTNVVASCDGVILQLDTVQGQAVVKVGDAVRRGDLLISGVMDSKVGPQLKNAEGIVIARTTHTLSCTVPFRDTISMTDRTVTQTALDVFGFEIPLYTFGNMPTASSVSVEHRPVMANNVPLPLGITRTHHTYLTDTAITRTPSEARVLAEERLAEKERALVADFTIENREVTMQKTADSITVTAVYVGTQNLAEKRRIAQ